MTTPILEINGVSKDFGGVKALQCVDLVGLCGEVHGLIGPNGAGKSTLIGCITGVNRWFTGLSGYLRIFTSLSSKEIAGPVYAALEAVGIAELAREQVGSLPYGKRHFVELARALVGRPEAILLDEPATGLTDAEREALTRLVRRIAASGALVVLVEHDLELVGRLCDRVTVIEYGRRIFNGNPTDAQQDAQVVKAYLGSSRFARETNRVPAA